MGWTMSDTFYVAPGKTLRINFTWDAPGNRGAQWVMGHPEAGEYGTLSTERVGKKSRCTIGQLAGGKHSCGAPSTAYWQYFTDIKNFDNNACKFKLQGGGV